MFVHAPVTLTEMTAVTTDTGRQYMTPEGVNLPSITTVLSILSRDSIAKWRARVGEKEANRISYRASTRGTSVHEICEKYVNNDPDWNKYMAINPDNGEMKMTKRTPDLIDSFLKMKPILDERLTTVYAQEAPLYSTHLGVAGRVDCVGIFDGKLSIIDYKTAMKPKRLDWIKNYFMQESAYAIMWEERTGMPITQLVTIISVDNHEPQVFVEHRDNWVRPLRDTIAQYNEENSANSFDI
jgi:genome maintenance exonuclease 1|tara:strand:- start:1546 stop:2265 length:720 start_codon:yes stop_codon:yes gene_type:complete